MTENIFSTSRQEINSWKVKKKYTEVGYKKKNTKNIYNRTIPRVFTDFLIFNIDCLCNSK